MTQPRFDEAKHPRGQVANAGQFASKTNSAPGGALSTPRSAADEARERRTAAVELYLKSRDVYLQANRDAVVAILRERFPWATTAVFTRDWSSDFEDVELTELIGPDRSETPRSLTVEDGNVTYLAQRWVGEMGEDVTSYLDLPDVDHEGWYEYQLDLTPGEVAVDGQAPAIPKLEDPETRAWKLLGDPSGTGTGWVGYDSLHRATVRAIKATREETR